MSTATDTEKMSLQLGVVQETLLLPLLARAEESQWKESILRDEKARELIAQLDFDYQKAAKQVMETGILGLAVRGLKMDREITRFLATNPEGKVLNIGAGLDTAFYRCDNGRVRWYDLDLPDSMEVRRKLLPEANERVTYIAKSMFDYSWIDDIGDISEGLFIIIPGVLPYFKELEVREFFCHIAPRLPGAQVMFDATSNLGRLIIGRQIKKAGMPNASLGWGIISASQLESWSEHIEVVRAEKFFKGIERKKSYSSGTRRLMFWNDVFSTSHLFQIRFV
jgi:O-methyltransferase involved in polyketide biosynthesis